LAGIFTNRSKNGFGNIRDGSSNTLLSGEAFGSRIQDGAVEDVSFSWIACGAMSTAWGLTRNDGKWSKFSSWHPGVVQFCYADGAVRGISRDIDYWVFVYLSCMDDGRPTQSPN
jgi:hypothetical protein